MVNIIHAKKSHGQYRNARTEVIYELRALVTVNSTRVNKVTVSKVRAERSHGQYTRRSVDWAQSTN